MFFLQDPLLQLNLGDHLVKDQDCDRVAAKGIAKRLMGLPDKRKPIADYYQPLRDGLGQRAPHHDAPRPEIWEKTSGHHT